MSTEGTITTVAYDVELEVGDGKWNATHCGAPSPERARERAGSDQRRRRIVEVTNVRTVRVVEYIEPDSEDRPWMVSSDTATAIHRALDAGYVDPVDYDD